MTNTALAVDFLFVLVALPLIAYCVAYTVSSLLAPELSASDAALITKLRKLHRCRPTAAKFVKLLSSVYCAKLAGNAVDTEVLALVKAATTSDPDIANDIRYMGAAIARSIDACTVYNEAHDDECGGAVLRAAVRSTASESPDSVDAPQTPHHSGTTVQPTLTIDGNIADLTVEWDGVTRRVKRKQNVTDLDLAGRV